MFQPLRVVEGGTVFMVSAGKLSTLYLNKSTAVFGVVIRCAIPDPVTGRMGGVIPKRKSIAQNV